MVSPITPGSPSGPVGSGGPSSPTAPLSPLDTTSSSPLAAGQFTPAASKPQLPVFNSLQMVGEALALNKTQQIMTQGQDASLRKSYFNANAQVTLTAAQEGSALLQVQLLQLNIASQTTAILTPVDPAINSENGNVPTENQQINDLNASVTAWNAAKAAYVANPSISNKAALTLATANYDAAKQNYQTYISGRNIGINTYNAAVDSAQTALNAQPDGVNAEIAQENVLNIELGLPLAKPTSYQLKRTILPDAPGTPDISNLNNLPPDLPTINNNNTPPRTPVDNSAVSISAAINSFFNSISTIVSLLLQTSALNLQAAENSANNFEYQFFNLQQKLDPSIAKAYVQKNPLTPDSQQPTLGSSAILAALSTPTANVGDYTTTTANAQAYNRVITTENTVQDNKEAPDQSLNDPSAVGRVNIDQIKLNAAIYVRLQEGTGLSINNPSMQVALGLETVGGIQNALASGQIDQSADGLFSKSITGNPELDQSSRIALNSAINIQYGLLSTHELAEALDDPNISALLLQATPGLEDLQDQLANAPYTNIDDLLTNPISQATIGIDLADQLNKEDNLDPQDAVAIASVVVRSLAQQPLQNLQNFKTALVNSLLSTVNPTIASKIATIIIAHISEDRKAASLASPLAIAASRQQAIVNQVTSNANEQSALLAALTSNFVTGQELKTNAIAALAIAGVSATEANALGDKVARVAVLDTAVQNQFNARAGHLSPGLRQKLETDVAHFVSVPQKVSIVDKQDRDNPLSIPSQIAHHLAIIKAQGNPRLTALVQDEVRKAARETYGDFVQRKRAESGTLYLHQTQNAGSPFVGTSALPKTNFGNPAMPIGAQPA